MKKTLSLLGILLISLWSLSIQQQNYQNPTNLISAETENPKHWFLLKRKSNQEILYLGNPGKVEESAIVKTFNVKSGIPNERPTPLPNLLGREFWILTDKVETPDNPETAPYFLTLDIPVTDFEPYGPTPYRECNGQCNWILPGSFGLHGVAGNPDKLSDEDLGSSGCIRHSDEDIAYLFSLLDPKKDEIRYYIEDI